MGSWDDEDFVYANKYVADFRIDKFFTQSQTVGRDKVSNYFRPVPQIAYATVHGLFGFNPFWYHLLNIIVHIGAACAVFYFFVLLIKSFSHSQNSSFIYHLSFLISLLFLIHPVQTEAVSYISGLSDPLFVLFGFLSLIYYLKYAFCAYVTIDDRHKQPTPTSKYLALSLVFFLLCLLAKESGLVFLGLLTLYSLLFTKPSRSNLSTLLPFSLISAVYLWYHQTFINMLNMKAAWGNNPYATSIIIRLLTFIQNLATYVTIIVFPKDLFMERDYSVHIQTQLINPYLIGFLLVNLFFIFLIIKFRHLLRIYHLSLIIFCYLAFYLSFLPYSGIVLINGMFYEHFLYLPLVFFFAFWLLLLEPLWKNKLVRTAGLIFLIGLIGRNVLRQFDWSDAIRFYTQTLVHAPQSIRIRNGLAMAYADKGDLTNAIDQYQKAISLNPNVPNLYHNLANAYLALGNTAQAEKYYLQAITVDPKFLYSWQALANLYQQTNQKDKLEALIKKYQTSP